MLPSLPVSGAPLYPWHRLIPLQVHRDFKRQVWAAVEERCRADRRSGPDRLDRWRRLCHSEADWSALLPARSPWRAGAEIPLARLSSDGSLSPDSFRAWRRQTTEGMGQQQTITDRPGQPCPFSPIVGEDCPDRLRCAPHVELDHTIGWQQRRGQSISCRDGEVDTTALPRQMAGARRDCSCEAGKIICARVFEEFLYSATAQQSWEM